MILKKKKKLKKHSFIFFKMFLQLYSCIYETIFLKWSFHSHNNANVEAVGKIFPLAGEQPDQYSDEKPMPKILKRNMH